MICRLLPAIVVLTAALFSFAGSPAASAADPITVSMETSAGTMVLELYPDKAPVTVKNFLQYVQSGFYNGIVFHRVIPGFMIQTGGRTADMVKKPTNEPIINEATNGLKNKEYTLAMARTGDPDSATSQFFINTNNNDNLDRPNPDGHGYAVFGKVIQGMDVVDAIEGTKTQVAKDPSLPGQLMQDVPEQPITITQMQVIE